MTNNLARAAFEAASLPDDWSLRILKCVQDDHDTKDAALMTFNAGFVPEHVLATCRSGVICLSAGQALPDTLGEPLHMEACHDDESRILRYLGSGRWRVTRLIDGEGDSYIADTVRWLGSGAAGEGAVGMLQYRRYWSFDDDGAMRAVAARLTGVDLAPQAEGDT